MEPKVFLISRTPAGYERDRFIFKVNNKKFVRYYGNRYFNEQAISMFINEIKQASCEGNPLF